MQQEIHALKSTRFGSIAEEGSGPPTPKMGLSRSASLMRGSNPVTLSRSNSVSSKKEPRESRDSLAERVKEIEAQRDALHQALKNLLDRQKFQAREYEKRVKAIEQERDRALEASSPRRRGYEKEVKDLRYEINELRRRAEDALEQKWQCEKGLGGLKMDLDRAEQETSSLRMLLVENDILVPDMSNLQAANLATSGHATSATLEHAYKELREAQQLSIERLRELKGISPSSADDAKTSETLDLLLKNMSNAEAERDYAKKQAETYRARAESLRSAQEFQEGENASLANQLTASAARVELLSSQVKRQLDSNSDLRERLAEAVGKGEREQQQSADRINVLQNKLKHLEDRVMAAQQHSEDSMAIHEEDVRIIRKSNNPQLQRLRPSNSANDLLKVPNSPLNPRSPKLDKTTSGPGMSMTEALRTEFLESRVKELENALSEAEREMGEVVQRMNAAQIEVMELQSARYEVRS
jgi:chromosome segregation ATPase